MLHRLLLAPAVALALLGTPAFAGPIEASSTGETEGGRHPAALAVDGLLGSGWALAGDPAGQWLELDLGAATEIKTLSIWAGNLTQGKRSFREYGRPKLVRILVDGKQVGNPVRLQDRVERLDVPVGATGRKLRLVVDEVFPGYVFEPVFLSEIAINFPELGVKGEQWGLWLTSGAAQGRQQRFEEELLQKYAAYKAQEFGDPEALAWIMDAAAEGAPYVREEVQKRVPPGWRAQAIPSSDKAREALRKLKDANAIPALEMAMLRSSGEVAAEIRETVEIFEAYQELIGNQNRTAPPWGESGFWRGALRGFGEPLALERDAEGNVVVADTGNNRVQRYGDNGLVNQTWGPAPEITDAWFGTGRKWYASGSKAGDGQGSFVNPIDVELLPGKEGTGIAVLGADNRVQVFDAAGGFVAGWMVETRKAADPGVGGEGYLAWSEKRGRLYVFVEDACVVYGLDGTRHDEFEIEDGTPDAVEIMKNGRLLLAFDGNVVRYDDGFRHSTLISRDQLSRGFEAMDMSFDEAGRLWVITDDGWVFKWKRPGKLEMKVKLTDYSLSVPRLAVYDGMVWYTHEDQVHQVDAYQRKLDLEQQEDAVRADELEL